mgnify:CR=1 FL=1
MTIEITPSQIKGEVTAPPSKSMAHRLLICAALSEGKSVISNIAYSEDILATLDCIKAMGAEVEIKDNTVSICGILPFSVGESTYNCRESGSTIRFFIPISMLSEGISLFTVCGRLCERPMEVYEKIAAEKGIYYCTGEDGIFVGGSLSSGTYTVRGDISSQFISGLLFALPLCDGDSVINLEGKAESRSYIDMTLSAMSSFGVKAEWKSEGALYVKGGQKYKACNISVEGDYSNAAFLDAFNLVNGNVTVNGLFENSLQGDRVYKDYYSLLEKGAPVLDMGNCPDLAPVIMALACELNGATLKGTKRLKLKESDRGAVMAQELSKLGAEIDLYEDEIIIHKSELKKPEAVLSGHNDHRVVMSLSVLMSKYGGVIESADAVKKSYPDFFSVIGSLGAEVTEI